MVDELYKSPNKLDEPVILERPLSPLNQEDNKIVRIKRMGVIQIVVGALCGLVGGLWTLGIALSFFYENSVPEDQRMPVGSMIFSIVMWIAMSASLIWVGVGGVKLRRWVRSVVLAINWPVLIFGILTVVGMVWLMPGIIRHGNEVAQSATGMATGDSGSTEVVATIAGAVFAFLFVVVFPGLHVLLYRSESVQKTLEAYDPKLRWTDGLPVAVVGLAIWLPSIGLSDLGTASNGLLLLFGHVFTGAAAWFIAAIVAAVCCVLALLAVRRRPAAWWGSLAVSVYKLSGAVSYMFVSLEDAYRQTGLYSEAKIAMMSSMDFATQTTSAFSSVAWVGAVVFLFAIRKHFV